jgi:hypothetical protein
MERKHVSAGGADTPIDPIEEVFTTYHHQVPNDMPPQEVNDLLVFLLSS